MKFLKKLGQIILKGTKLVLGLGATGVVSAGTATVVVDKLREIRDVIINVEVFGQALGLVGSSKLTAAGPAVAQVILSSAILADRKIDDAELFAQGATKIADGMACVLNSLKDDIKTEDK